MGAFGRENGAFLSAGELAIQAGLPSAKVFTPGSLSFNSQSKGVVVTNAQGIKQVKTPQVIAVVTTNSAIKYTITLYSVTNITGYTNGAFLIAGSAAPLSAITVENADGTAVTTNSVRITSIRDSITSIADYVYSSGAWQLTTGGGIRTELETITTTNAVRTILHEIKAGAAVLRSSTRRYQTFSWGTALIESVEGAGADGRTNSYTYNTNGWLRQVMRSDGRWEIFVYDNAGRPTNIFSAWLNQEPTTNGSLCRVSTNIYSSAIVSGSGDDSNNQPSAPRLTVESVLGTEVSRRYAVYFPGTAMEIHCTGPGVAWDNGTNLITTTRYFTNGGFNRMVDRIYYPGSTMDIFHYTSNATTFASVRESGWPSYWSDPGDEQIIMGSATSNIVTHFGQPVSRTIVNFYSPYNNEVISYFTVSAEAYSDTDGYGRPRRIDYSDGTWSYTDYGCCGGTIFTNREGTVTTHTYDALNRLVATTSAGITMSNVYDLADSIIAVNRHGTDSTVIANSTAVYNTAGELVSRGNGAGNTNAFTSFFDGSGYHVEVMTFPDLTTKTNRYFHDGQLYQSFGSGAFPVTYAYGPTNDGAGRLFAHEQHGSATEWSLTIRDMQGRHYKTLFASPSAPHPYTRSYYDAYGALARFSDAMTNTTLYTPSVSGSLSGIYSERDSYVALDMNRNGSIDLESTDRITRRRDDYIESSVLGVWLERVETYEWAVDNESTAILTSTTERTFDGLHSVTTRFGLTNRVDTVFAGSGARYVTNALPDGTYTVSTFQDGRLVRLETRNPELAIISLTTFGYDPHGRQNKMTNAANGTSTTYEYDKADRVTNVIVSAIGLVDQSTKSVYDNMGRVIRTTLPDGTSVTNVYHASSGMLATNAGSHTHPVAYQYDSQGRMTDMTTWQAYPSSGAATTVWKYDAYRGFMTNKVYADGSGPSYTHDALGRITQRKWARGTNTTYAYNAAGELLIATYSDPGTPSITNSHDRRGRTTTIKQGTNATTRLYDDAGNLLSENYTAGILAGMALTNRFDALLRRTTNGLLNGSTWLAQTRYTYDAASRLFSVSDGTSSAAYAYLTNSPLVSTVLFTNGGVSRMTTRKQYDGFYRLASISSSNSAAGVLSSHGYTYNSVNQRARVDREDGTYWVYDYDVLGQMKSGKTYWSDGTPIAGQQFEYGFDDIGNRKTAASGGDQWGTNLRHENYTPNSLNQYSQRTVPDSVDVLGVANSNAVVTVNLQSTYRKGEYFRASITADNSTGPVWLGLTNVGVLFNTTNDIVTTNTGNTLLAPATETYLHDLDGNLVRNGLWTNLWNTENRWITAQSLTTVSSSARQKVDFAYDYQGRRVQKVVSTWNGSGYVAQSTNRFLYDGWNLLAIVNSASGVSQSFLWGLDLSGSLQGSGGVGGLLAMNAGTTSTHFVAFDGNGNVSALASVSDGTNTATYDYSPFGQVLRASGPVAKANVFRFSTKLHDDEVGTVYYGLRDYDPFAGRWSSRDPIDEIGDANLYAFLRNGPQDHVDPLGEDAFLPYPGYPGPYRPLPSPPPPPTPPQPWTPPPGIAILGERCCCSGGGRPRLTADKAYVINKFAITFMVTNVRNVGSGCYDNVQVLWNTCWMNNTPNIVWVPGSVLGPSIYNPYKQPVSSGPFSIVANIKLEYLWCNTATERWEEGHDRVSGYTCQYVRNWPLPGHWECD
jgi:RHS repeat-associated protein